MLASLLSGLFGAGASIFQNRANRKAQREQNQFNANQAALDRSFQSAEAEIARDWQEKFYTQYQSPEAMVRQYEAAGLNPAMMYGGSGPSSGSVPTTAVPSGSQASASQTYFMDAMNIMEAVLKLDGLKAAIEKDKKEGYKAEMEGDEARENAAGKQIENVFKPDLLRQDLETGKVNIDNLKAGIEKLNSESQLNKDQLLTNIVERRLKNASADKIIEETNKIILEQATESLKQKNISITNQKLLSEITLIEAQRGLTALQSTLTNMQVGTEKNKMTGVYLDNVKKEWENSYREFYGMEPNGSSWGVVQQYINSLAGGIINFAKDVF